MAHLVTSVVDKYHDIIENKSGVSPPVLFLSFDVVLLICLGSGCIVDVYIYRDCYSASIHPEPRQIRRTTSKLRKRTGGETPNKKNPRVNGWAMMSSPFPTLFICVFYAYFSKVIGPKLMENRKPLNLRNILIGYNLVQTIFSAWIFYEFLMSGWWGSYSFRCQPVDYSNNPMALRMARTCWWYYFSKFTEFFDTLFFILRKKNSHVSTLHVIHHGCMPFSVWMGMKFAPGGHSTFFSLLNAFVHIIMYFYYMVTAMGPQYQKYIWWKKYLTTFQMVQFVAIFTHQFQLLFIECNYPKGFMVWIALHGIMFLFLFSDFYKVKYAKSKKAVTNKNGACMPLLDDEKTNGHIKKSNSNGTLSNTYVKSEYSDSYEACYSNGSTNGFVTQTIVKHNGKKIE